MSATFEVGKTYIPDYSLLDPITVLSRTNKSIYVTDKNRSWRMFIKKDNRGNEYVVDSSQDKDWQEAYTYCATDDKETVDRYNEEAYMEWNKQEEEYRRKYC